jgi:FkbM family methyltransferase
LPKFRGKNRLARLLFHRLTHSFSDADISGKFGIQYKVPNIGESIGFELFVNGIYEQENIKLIIESIPKSGIFIDIGANIGAISIPIAKIRPDITLYAIEASPRVFSYLKHNVETNKCTNIILLNRAMAEEDDKLVSFYSPEKLFGKGSFLPVYTDTPESVITQTLDSLAKIYNLDTINFIKIDVEGFEKSVLSGGNSVLTREFAPQILFEFSDEMEGNIEGSKPGCAQDLLRKLNYSLYDVSKSPNRPLLMPFTIRKGCTMIFAKKQ